MPISSAKATFGLDAVGTGTRPWISQTALIGQSATAMQLTASTIAFAAELYLQSDGDTGTLTGTNLATNNDINAAVAASVTINPTGVDNSILYAAGVAGEAGNDITVEYVISGTGSTCTVAISGTAITVTAGSACVASTVITAVNDLFSEDLFVSASASGSVTGVIAAVAATALTGGKDATDWIGSIVDFEGSALANPSAQYALLVYCESGSASISVNSGATLTSITSGGKWMTANTSGITDLLGNIVFTATSNDTRIRVALFGS